MILPTIRQLQYLIALRDGKSFSDAAEICHVTQPTLSAGIKELENILGQPVIDRSKRKVILTALGHETARDAQDIIAQAEAIMRNAKRLSEPMTGAMRLGVIPTIAPYLLPDILPQIQRTFPALELQLFEDMSERLVEKLRSGEIDCALIAFPYETPDMVQEFLFDEPFYLAVPKSKNKGQNTPFEHNQIKSEDLDPGELLLLEDGHCLSDHALSACDLQLPKRRKAYSASSLPTLLQMVANGYGITLVPEMAVSAGAIPKGVEVHRFAAPMPHRKIGLIWRENHPQTGDFRTLGDAIKDS